MSRESLTAKRARLGLILVCLRRAYPDAHCELVHRNPLELLVATILSAQCTDRQVNIVTKELFKTYHTARDYAEAPLEDLTESVRRIGFFRNKAKNIRACCQKLVTRHAGEVPMEMESLTSLDGVGRKTANVVLGNAFGINVGVVVDTHVARLSGRIGLTTANTPEKIEKDLMHLLPGEDWTQFSHLLIWHGRRRCSARKPHCAACEIAALCPRKGIGKHAAGGR
ncbi:MAG: endonuclease III [Verrucomicrobiae bacterium]|jgi:endonuclease-3|nr:endonuclease III [Verrucomicrobiae bacterium]